MKIPFFRYLSIIIISLISISIVNSAGNVYCAQLDSNGKLPSNVVGKKFNPGHYTVITGGLWNKNQADRIRDINRVIIPHDHIKGAQPMFGWAELEPSRGNYDFSSIRETLDLLAANDKHMVMYIIDRTFSTNGCNGAILMPQYLVNQGLTFEDEKNKCMPRAWEDAYIDNFINLLNAIGDEFNDHPYFEMIILPETTLPFPPKPGGGYDKYSFEVYKDQLIRQLEEPTSLDNTAMAMGLNFLAKGQDEIMQSLIDDGVVATGNAMAWPDPFPRNGITHPQQFVKDNKGLVYTAPQANTAALKLGDSKKVLDYYVDDLGASHIFWNSWFTNKDRDQLKPEFEDLAKNYYTGELFTALRNANYKISTQCPSSVGTCLDTSPSCSGNSNPPTGNSCDQIGTNDQIFEGYAAPFFFDDRQLLMKSTCEGNSANVDIGKRNKGIIVYKYGYIWKNNDWQQVELDGSLSPGGGIWLSETATASINGLNLNEDNYFLSYMCKLFDVGEGQQDWKCGCHDSSCSTKFWNLQIIKEN